MRIYWQTQKTRMWPLLCVYDKHGDQNTGLFGCFREHKKVGPVKYFSNLQSKKGAIVSHLTISTGREKCIINDVKVDTVSATKSI